MKKFYSTILAIIFSATALMAQESESTFAFMYKGEVVPNGSTVTISEYTDMDFIIEMIAPIYIKNVSTDATLLTLGCSGKENYAQDIQFCPDGSCRMLPSDGSELTVTYKDAIQPDSTVEKGTSWLHVTIFDTKSFKGSVEVRAFSAIDPDDCTTITVVFDTDAAQGINKVSSDSRKMEVYNLCGKKIATSMVGLPKGIYIIKQNGASRKVVIK